MIDVIKKYFQDHWLAFLLAFIVGIIYLMPHVWFIITNGDAYQGIPFMQNANEDFYIARMQEIIDGHPLVGSQALFEYKDQFPLSPPTVEILYALPTLALGIPLVTTLTASKFILPLLLFWLVYSLLYRLLGQSNKWPEKLSAIAGALFITLGYDLVDYRTVLSLIKGTIEPSSWLIWSRPVHPIMGAIYLFSFLLFLWSVVQNTKRIKISIVGAGVFLALMFSSYFFSWGLALSIGAMLGLFYLLRRDYAVVKRLIFIPILGILFSSPYWYLSWQAKQSIWYENGLLRNGIFFTHYPLLNKVLIAALVIYIVALVFKFFKNSKLLSLDHADIFLLAFLFGGLFALNQQIITGITIWPFHFVQYTIPLSIIVVIVILHRFVREYWRLVWVGSIGIIVVASLWLGVYTQYKTYVNFLDHNKEVQLYAPVFDWFNQQERDCVVLVSGGLKQSIELSGLVLAFTHCNIYSNTWVFSLLPEERIAHNYLVNLRFRGVAGDNIEEYLSLNSSEMRNYLFSNWAGLYEVTKFPDFEDSVLPQRLERFPDDYREFLDKDFKMELNKYRLDYILSVGPLSQDLLDQLSEFELTQEINGLFIYK